MPENCGGLLQNRHCTQNPALRLKACKGLISVTILPYYISVREWTAKKAAILGIVFSGMSVAFLFACAVAMQHGSGGPKDWGTALGLAFGVAFSVLFLAALLSFFVSLSLIIYKRFFRLRQVSPATLTTEVTVDRKIEKLYAATSLVAFENTLRSASNTVAYYGAFFLLFGVIFTVRFGIASSWSALAIGVALLGESFYIRRTRSPRALWVSGISFAIFAAWFFGSLVVGLAKKDPTVGKGIIAGVFLAIGAWNILRSYSTYKALLETSDPTVNHYVRETLERMRTASTSEHAQIIEFKKRGIGEKGTWRLQPDGDLLLICQFADKAFGFGGRPQQAAYILRRDVQIHHEGDRWLGRNINATLSIGGAENKVQLKPEMLARLESLLTGTSSAPTDANG